ncbi:chemotaxis-specific protein-glutamate methyltransferase CheB [Halomonas sp. PAMB 3232]|uniref:chemotaxis-specific protein-glutamate methyltransferase CheB n=1 Tax=Halomonas sp. PAMB 3232 TaxID=3075221 RepID=UPI0028A26261|nr:chemotaxis-specific protein-glutamate methyltransferase CheB [Halomonas sp. PAMB 3232]WNL38563.1 chemotaxis-specific protein-glutamate methyltransferase CheB [Halomonas sp. PAMB 3232]
MSAIRVVIVDDSPVARDVLRHILARENDIEIVGEGSNGQEAVTLARRLAPHIMTMDLSMPVMNGLAAIKEIMHTKALPILVVSERFEAQAACQALELGALEVIGKPAFDGEDAQRLVERIRLLSGVAVITRMRRRAMTPCSLLPNTTAPLRAFQRIVAIACSTGGPQALARLLSRLPTDFIAPIVIAQHISPGFIEGMAQWLSTICTLPVNVARDGDHLKPGCIYLSPSESDLEITADHTFKLLPSPPGSIYHPSCDTLLSSVAEVYGPDAVGIILTGMGRDGVQGMNAIRLAGGTTIAQDEASSVIYGMNQEAVRAGSVQRVVALEQLPEHLIETLHTPRWPRSSP